MEVSTNVAAARSQIAWHGVAWRFLKLEEWVPAGAEVHVAAVSRCGLGPAAASWIGGIACLAEHEERSAAND